MAVTLGALCNAIAATFEAGVPGLSRVFQYDEIPEGVNAGDTPLLMVYFEGVLSDPTGETDRLTFGTGADASIKIKEMLFRCDFYTSQRAHAAEDVADAIDLASVVIDVIEGQNEYPYWQNGAIKSARAWDISRVVFEFAGATYPGFRLELTVWVY